MRSRAATLAFLELCGLILLSCGVMVWWRRPSPWTGEVAWHGVWQMLAPMACLVSAFYYTDLYDFRAVRTFAEFCVRLPRAVSVAVIFTVALYSLVPALHQDFHVFPFGLWGVATASLVALLLRGMICAVSQTNAFAERVLILGTGPLAWKIAEELEAASRVADDVTSFVSDSDIPYRKFSTARHKVIGALGQLEQIIIDFHPDRIIVALSERRGRLPVRTLLEARMAGIVVEDGVEVHERLTGKLAIESLTPSFLIFSKDFKKSHVQMALRRAVSLAVAVVGLLIFAPIMFLAACAIKVDSAGPVFFIQERAGLRGRAFRLVKFRTMRPESHEASVWEQDNRYRITLVGKWLRRFRLDELPQFFNVLRGDMNLVGPRPHPVSNYKFFLEKIPYYALRSAVRPGMTGWAQVCYVYANNLEEETEKMRYDLFYIKNLSLWLDLRIILDTIKTVLFGHKEKDHVTELNLGAQKISMGMSVDTLRGQRTHLPEPAEAETTNAAQGKEGPLDVLRRSA